MDNGSLRGVERAEISETKIVKYLLSTTHRAGKSKATFFMEFGFDPRAAYVQQ
ncbi:MAG: DUF6883 domain-containing protein [Candidatus Binatia bacterium]